MRIAQLMSQPVVTCSEHDDLSVAARLMWDHDCGVVPVVSDEGKLVGVVTDRDICMATWTQGRPPHAISVASAMAKTPVCCHPEEALEVAERAMSERRIRRVPVVDAEEHPVGILSLNDIAREAAKPRNVANGTQRQLVETMARICQPRAAEVDAPAAEKKAEPKLAAAAV